MADGTITLHAAPINVSVSQRTLAVLSQDSIVARIESAYTLGFQAGLTQAHEGAARSLEAAAARVDQAREQATAELTQTAIDLAITIAGEIVRREIDRGAYEIERIVRESLACSGVERGNCVVHVHPQDFEALQGVAFRSGTEIEADNSVARGDVHVSTPRGLLVRETDAALDSIRARLSEDLRS